MEVSKEATGEEDVFHFVSYLPFKGQLYELDGLQQGPIAYGPVTQDNWLERAREEIQQRIQRYAQSEIRFNLLAVTGDKRDQANKELDNLQLWHRHLQGEQVDQAMLSEEQKQPLSEEQKQAKAVEVSSLVEIAQAQLKEEQEKNDKWKSENQRRKHNYVPLIFELLQQLAKKDMLQPLMDQAVEAKQKKLEEKKKNKDQKA